MFNTARQAGGALGAAVLGTLLIAEAGMSLRTPMIVIIAAYAAAIGLTLLATTRRARPRVSAKPLSCHETS